MVVNVGTNAGQVQHEVDPDLTKVRLGPMPESAGSPHRCSGVWPTSPLSRALARADPTSTVESDALGTGYQPPVAHHHGPISTRPVAISAFPSSTVDATGSIAA
jgi:hypothetical protein